MSVLKIKSGENIGSATLLIKNSYFASSIHCSYYSNVQLMLHILLEDLKKTEQDIEVESRQGSIDEHGYHNWIKSIISRELVLRNFKIIRDFNNILGQLKALRVKADYKNIEMNIDKAKKASGFANLINEILKENFKI